MTQNFKKGTTVWAKMKGYPFWPGIIAEPLKTMKKPAKNNVFCVYFFGSKNYSWIDAPNLKDYKTNKAEMEKCKKTSSLKTAIEDIENFLKQSESLSPNDDPFSLLIPSSKTPKIKKENKRKSSVDEEIPPAKSPKKVPTPRRNIRSSFHEKLIPTPKKSPETQSDKSTSEIFSAIFPPVRSFRSPAAKKIVDIQPINLEQKPKELLDKKIKPSKLTFGFIGMGAMGSRILKNLVQSNHKVLIWNRTERKCLSFKDASASFNVRFPPTPFEVVREADVTFLCVSDGDAVNDIMYSKDQLMGFALKLGNKGLVNMSGVTTESSVEMSEVLEGYMCNYLEVRFIGTHAEADKGLLHTFAAGDESLFNSCESCLNAFSSVCTYLGPDIIKMSKIMKLMYATQAIWAQTLSEQCELLKKLGGSGSQFFGLLAESPFFKEEFSEKCQMAYLKDKTLPVVSPQSSVILGELMEEMFEAGIETLVCVPAIL